MVEKAEDTIYQRLYISVERLTRLLEYEGHCRIIIQQEVWWSTTELM